MIYSRQRNLVLKTGNNTDLSLIGWILFLNLIKKLLFKEAMVEQERNDKPRLRYPQQDYLKLPSSNDDTVSLHGIH